jgi:cytochrome c
VNGRALFAALGGAMGLSFLLSFVHVSGNPRKVNAADGPLLAGAQIPDGLRMVIVQKCADCHSEKTHWPLYSRFAPASWLLEHDVAEARSHWDASHWNGYTREEQMDLLSRFASRVRVGSMPPARYTLLHPDHQLDADERAGLYRWAKGERQRLRAAAVQLEKTNGTTSETAK